MQDKITMPQPPHMHCNHPPITPHPKTVFLPDLSVCITNSSEGTPVVLHNRFTKLSTISEIPEIPNSPPPLPRQMPHHPPHTFTHTHPHVHTHTYVTDPLSPHFFLHCNISFISYVHNHYYTSLPRPPSKQTDAITKVTNWMNDVCSNPSSSAEEETAAISLAPEMYAEDVAASPTQPPALAITSPIHSPTHSNTYTLQ